MHAKDSAFLVGAPGDSWAYWNLNTRYSRVMFIHSFYKYILGFILVESCPGHQNGEEMGYGEQRPKPTLLLLTT